MPNALHGHAAKAYRTYSYTSTLKPKSWYTFFANVEGIA